jgi:hypothetical protein
MEEHDRVWVSLRRECGAQWLPPTASIFILFGFHLQFPKRPEPLVRAPFLVPFGPSVYCTCNIVDGKSPSGLVGGCFGHGRFANPPLFATRLVPAGASSNAAAQRSSKPLAATMSLSHGHPGGSARLTICSSFSLRYLMFDRFPVHLTSTSLSEPPSLGRIPQRP